MRAALQTHPKADAARLVEIRETVHEILIPTYVEAVTPAPSEPHPLLFERYDDEQLLGYGVPEEWLDDVRAATEELLLGLVDYLPGEAAEALLELAKGGKPRTPELVTADPFEHLDAQRRRCRIMADADERARALDFPWEKSTDFLLPEQ